MKLPSSGTATHVELQHDAEAVGRHGHEAGDEDYGEGHAGVADPVVGLGAQAQAQSKPFHPTGPFFWGGGPQN